MPNAWFATQKQQQKQRSYARYKLTLTPPEIEEIYRRYFHGGESMLSITHRFHNKNAIYASKLIKQLLFEEKQRRKAYWHKLKLVMED